MVVLEEEVDLSGDCLSGLPKPRAPVSSIGGQCALVQFVQLSFATLAAFKQQKTGRGGEGAAGKRRDEMTRFSELSPSPLTSVNKQHVSSTADCVDDGWSPWQRS